MFQTIILFTTSLWLLKAIPGIEGHGKHPFITSRGEEPAGFTDALTIVVHPADLTDCKGNKVTFGVATAGGIGSIHYQWQRQRPGEATFSAFGAPDSTRLPVYNIGVGNEAPDGTLYRVTVTDQNSSITSGTASLKVNQIAGIAPVGVASYTVMQGENLSFRVLTSGNPPSAYQWIKKLGSSNWPDVTDKATISGSREELLRFTKIAVADSGIYKVRVTFPTMNGNQCIETSSITRTIHVIPVDTEPPLFVNLSERETSICPDDLVQATWNDALADILPERSNACFLNKNSPDFDLAVTLFYDNLTPPADLVLHWGIYSAAAPFLPISDQAGVLLDDKHDQLSSYPEAILLEPTFSGNGYFQIIFWLEDRMGNLTPVADRHKVTIAIPARPEIVCDF